MLGKRVVTILSCALLVSMAGPALAQLNHMSCFKVKDSQKFSALATLDAGQDAFDPGQCKVIGKAKFFCVPSSKLVDEFIVDKAPGTLIPIGSADQTTDQVCYKVKCPKVEIPDEVVVDQFGIRTMSKFKVQLMCGPAHKQAPVCAAPDPPQCPFSDPCTNGICSTTRVSCSQQNDCPLQPSEECCCNGICI